MTPSINDGSSPIETVTHARIRAEQGDVEGARRILRARLERDPNDEGAKALLITLTGAENRGRTPEPADEALAPPQAGRPEELKRLFRSVSTGRGPVDRARARKARLLTFLEAVRRRRERQSSR